ncbi:AMIN domain-containing protein [Babesia caballi]|uniref:AMIN domain-containing protein n=1 Tax=Babesia caballi TaxID=5871 RepID=A0AAV4LUN9_BABCB|nr:AMIN domain-containing protein [Babesia caballi]
MKDMGYDPTYLNKSKLGSQVAQLLTSGQGFDGLGKPDGYSMYSDFIRQLETQYLLPSHNALNHPLTACYKFAKLYFTSQFTTSQGTKIDGTLDEIKKAVRSFKSSCSRSAQDLQSEVGSFISKAMTESFSPTSRENNDPSPSSPAGAIAGTLATLGLGGGAAAAYLFNVGGAKTIVNGLLRIG